MWVVLKCTYMENAAERDPNFEVDFQIQETSRVMKPLTILEKDILRYRFGFDKENGLPRRLEEVGELFNMSREEVRRTELLAMHKLGENGFKE